MWRATYTVGVIVPLVTVIIYDYFIRGIPSPINSAQAHKALLGFVPACNYTQPQDSNGTDIIFVHGLGSNPDTTWQARRATDSGEEDVTWVSDFLPDDLHHLEAGDIRLYFFNFESFWKRDAVQVRLATIGNDFLEHMANSIRRSQEELNRDFIFVGYSYGGLVIKEALTLARGNPNFEYVSQHTKAIVFLGTPHRGSTFSTWGRRMARLLRLIGSNPSILGEIEYDSTMLLDLHTSFEASVDEKIQIVNVFEQRPTLLFSLWFFRWREFCVREQSAKFGGGKVRNIGLPVDHRGLNKFSSRNSNYQMVLSILSNAISSQPRQTRRTQGTKDEFQITLQLPVLRNNRFSGRTHLLQQVHRYFKDECPDSQQCIFALHGPGGIGKTQIAVEYAYSYKNHFSAVFWIDGASESAIRRSLTHAAEQVLQHFRNTHTNETEYKTFEAQMVGNVSYSVAKFSTAVGGIMNWLAQQQNDEWLLIFDNVDDLDSFDVRNYFPRVSFGSILITSRRKDISGYWRSTEVGEMSEEEGKSLFATNCGFDGEIDDSVIHELLELLGYFPLAIEQASAYISAQQRFLPEQPEQFTRAIQKYIEQYHVNAERLLTHRRPQSMWDYRNDTILTTWEVSLQRIEEEKPEAADLLFLSGFLSNNDIFEEMLSDDTQFQTHKESIHHLLRLLSSFSLVRFSSSMDAITIHPLIHYWIRQRLPLQRKQELSDRALRLLARTLRLRTQEGGLFDDYEYRLVPHIHAALENARTYLSKSTPSASVKLQNPPEHQSLPRVISLIYETPQWWYLWLTGQLQEAYLLFKSIHREEEQLEGDPWFLTYKLTIAVRDYNLRIAEKFFRWELSEAYIRLHPMHPRSLTIAGDLAWVLYRLQRFEESWRWYKWLLTARQHVLGRGHYATMGALMGLAALYEAEGKFDKALELRLTAYEGRLATLGKGNVLTQNAAEWVADHYLHLQKYDEADKWYHKSLEAEIETHGPKHENILRRVQKYRDKFASADMLDKQIQWAKMEYDILNAKYDSNHELAMDRAYHTAKICMDHKQYELAREWALMAFETGNHTHGPYHIEILRIMHTIGWIYEELSQSDKALEWYSLAFEGRNHTLGPNHEETLHTAHDIGYTYSQQAQFDKALEWFFITYKGLNYTLGPNHEDTLWTIYNIGLSYERQHQFNEALEYYSITFEVFNGTLGPDHEDTLTTAHRMEVVCRAQEQTNAVVVQETQTNYTTALPQREPLED